MKKTLAAILLALVSQVALALPTPVDIATAVRTGRLTDAESMLQVVIKAKPQSAKAYYELGQVFAMENRKQPAVQALHEAERLDASLKFAQNPRHFHELLGKLEGGQAAPAARSSVVAASSMPSGSGFPWIYVLIGGGLLFMVWLSMRRTAATASANSSANSMASGGANPAWGNGSMPPAGPYAPTAPGSGIGTAVMGGVAGMAAGYGLAKLMEHENGQPVQVPGGVDPTFTQQDYGDFDAGSGDSWDADDSSGGGDGW
jgi:hypothetical protein